MEEAPSFPEQRLIRHLLEFSARRYPDKIALVCANQRFPYGQLELHANRVARWLLDQGLTAGDRVLLVSENGLSYVVGYFGILKGGGVVVPVNTESKSHDLRQIAGNAGSVIVLASKRFEKLLLEADLSGAGVRTIGVFGRSLQWPDGGPKCHNMGTVVAEGDAGVPQSDTDPNSLASIIYTSGSTGKAKGVMLSHRNILSNVHAICKYQELSKNDIHLVVLPFFYVMGQSLLNTHFAVGATLVVNNQFAYPASVVKQMVDEQVTGFSGVPSTFAYLIHRSPLKKLAGSLQSLRFCAQAGGHMATHLKKELRAILPAHTRIFIMYGATEAAARITYLDPECFERKIGSIGMPIPGMEVRLLGPNKREMPLREEGELVASGPNIMLGYWRDPDATAAVLDHVGYHTGDVGYRDNEGFIYINGRKDSLLKVSGHRINPQEIEDALVASGLLIEVAVVGQPDEMAGNRLVAVATPRDETCRVEDLLRYSAERLPAFKVPSEIRLIKSLPKNASGKIDRHLCETLVRQAPDGR